MSLRERAVCSQPAMSGPSLALSSFSIEKEEILDLARINEPLHVDFPFDGQQRRRKRGSRLAFDEFRFPPA